MTLSLASFSIESVNSENNTQMLEAEIKNYLQQHLRYGEDSGVAYTSGDFPDKPTDYWGCDISALARLWQDANIRLKQSPYSYEEIFIAIAGNRQQVDAKSLVVAVNVLARMDAYTALVPERIYRHYGFYTLAIPLQAENIYWEFCFLSNCGVDAIYMFKKSSLLSDDCEMSFD